MLTHSRHFEQKVTEDIEKRNLKFGVKIVPVEDTNRQICIVVKSFGRTYLS